jgi:hypothetical protein
MRELDRMFKLEDKVLRTFSFKEKGAFEPPEKEEEEEEEEEEEDDEDDEEEDDEEEEVRERTALEKIILRQE